MKQFIVTAEIKLVIDATDELSAKQEVESQIEWLVDHMKIKNISEVGIDE